MRILLDECIDRHLAREVQGHTVKTVVQMGWAGVKNGQLLALAEKGFDVFVTVDRSPPTQQHLAKFKIAVLILSARTNRFRDLEPLVPKMLAAFPGLGPGRVVTIAI